MSLPRDEGGSERGEKRRMELISRQLLDGLSAAAKASPRRRRNHNLHRDYAEPCQRLLNALEPGTYVRPHRHLDPDKPETFVALRGRLAAFTFSDDGAIDRMAVIAPDGEILGVDIPAGAWHTIVALAEGSVFFETKPGPYQPLTDKDWAPWAPAEQDPAAAGYLEELMRAVEACPGAL